MQNYTAIFRQTNFAKYILNANGCRIAMKHGGKTMKRFITALLAIVMIVTSVTFVITVGAQDDGVLFSFNYQDKCNGVVDGKKTADTEKVTIDGVKALKIVPTPATALSPEIRLDCYSLTYPSSQLKGVKYMTVKYRYDGTKIPSNPMKVLFLTGGGGFSKNLTVTAKEGIKNGVWSVAKFDVSALNDNLVLEDGKIFKQFHFWPYGANSNPASLEGQIMYISDITFHSNEPDVASMNLPAVVDKPVATTTTPTTPSTPETKVEGALEGDENGFLTSFNYSEKSNGIVDRKATASTEKVEIDGQKALKIVPTPETAATTQIVVDSYSYFCKPKEIANARFMAIKYKLQAPEGVTLNKMGIRFIGGLSKRVLTKGLDTESFKPITSGDWTTAVFNVSQFKDFVATEDASLMLQFHLYPFGKGTNVNTLNGNYVMHISDISFYTINPDPDVEYIVSFKKGHPDISGEDPKSLSLKRGEKFTLPEITYDIGNAVFKGWKSSEDDKLYNPGAEYTVPDNNVVFTAQFDINAVLHDFLALPFVKYHDGSCERRDNIIITEDVLQGKDVVKVVPNPTGADVSKGAIIDGYSYGPAGVDLGAYKYLVITYYFDGTLPRNTYFYANIMKRSILTKSYGVKSSEPISAGRWNFALIDFSGIDEVLVPNLSSYVLQQMHIYPFNGVNVTDFKGDEALYINNLMFFKEKPDLEIHEAYMKGYDGGIFKPQGNMTRAEACTIVARLMAGGDANVPADKTTAFADVPNTEWYHKYVSYVESLGYLKDYAGNFEPNKAITRAEFVELVYNMGLLKDKGLNGTFTDVAADHPKAAVVAAAGKAGLVNGYDNGNGTFSFKPDNTITRAEVVKVINNAYGRSITTKQLSEEVKFSFSDVAKDFWAYADIMEATLAHVEDGKGWVFCMVSPFSIFGKTNDNLNYAAGEAFVKELDAQSEAKIAEIRNTPNMELSKITGQKYYVSNNGNDENDGKTPETAWKTIGRMVKESVSFKPGDAVLFERGGLWRERFHSKTGVTYTAYGEGNKPVLYGSPENGTGAENWTLLEGTTNIWVYKNELLDVGGIICDGGKTVGLKVLADLVGDKYYVRDTKREKEFVLTEALNEDLEFFSYIPNANALATQKGKLYFRCDAGNPGALFSQIEFNIKGHVISNGNATDTHFDNLCIMYTGTHGIGSGTTKNLKVTNCEIGWIGGTLQSYKDGRAVRLGNGVEIYGGCDGYLVDNNYIYQCYDAGATHQFSSGGTTNISMYNATYSNNIIEDCIYNIEYFTGYADDDSTVRDGKNFIIKNNILRRSGYGWGNQRPDGNTSAHIKSWAHRNEYEKGTFIIENNIFDRGAWKLLQTTADYEAWCPIYRNNTYVQVVDEGLCHHAALQLKFDCFAEESIKYELGDEGAKVYFLPASYKHNGFLSRK